MTTTKNHARRRVLKALPALALAGYLPRGLAAGGTQPNILFILADDLGYADLGVYGQTDIKTPNLDRLASEGVVFDHHFPENLTTLPTRRSWWTGRYGFAEEEEGWTPLRPEERILPDLLWDQGVRTALISDRSGNLSRCLRPRAIIWISNARSPSLRRRSTSCPSSPRARAARAISRARSRPCARAC